MGARWVYPFSEGKTAGHAGLKKLLGGKGANLAEMCGLGLPIPPGFTITTDACRDYYGNDKRLRGVILEEIREALTQLEKISGRKLGDPQRPLLVSVRSGARASMPGMMDTILNLGLNDAIVESLCQQSQNRRFVYDSYRRFIQMYGNVVMGIDGADFEDAIDSYKEKKGRFDDAQLDSGDWKALSQIFKVLYEEKTSRPFTQDVTEQLEHSIEAVFDSWQNTRARTYRRLHAVPDDWGTAVTVQLMVFGNRGDNSATGVAFTRDPSTGAKKIYGEYLVNAQGEDVVAGVRTPLPLSKTSSMPGKSLEETMPTIHGGLAGLFATLEAHYRDMQDIEFTIEEGKIWLLQTRAAKRSAQAAVKVAMDMHKEGLIDENRALLQVHPESLDRLLHPSLDPDVPKKLIAAGLPASPGAASGKVVFDPDEAEKSALQGESVILVRAETSPEDIHGMHAAKAIVTSRGGMTSHAAVVARGMGRPCVCGASGIQINRGNECFTSGGFTVCTGETITVDGSTGSVYEGAIKTLSASISDDFEQLMALADGKRLLGVRANAETIPDIEEAIRFGCEGIGLCRSEHMFFDEERILAMRTLILARDIQGRKQALTRLIPHQRDDYTAIFSAMRGKPVTVRLLDPPLHEFLPGKDDDLTELQDRTGYDQDEMHKKIEMLTEANPMLGHRGARLGVTFPEIYNMQAVAIFEAAIQSAKDTGIPPAVEIMIPLIAGIEEVLRIKQRIVSIGEDIERNSSAKLQYKLGVMIELPRAALLAGKIAPHVDFFSFGTNDLTQTTFGLSRDDSASFLPAYIEQGILRSDPFVQLDTEGVGHLVALACKEGRKTNPQLKLGICGEHGGDPSSIEFFAGLGLDYVSCSPYRVPIARLAAARCAIEQQCPVRVKA